jgi:hypothetical protein
MTRNGTDTGLRQQQHDDIVIKNDDVDERYKSFFCSAAAPSGYETGGREKVSAAFLAGLCGFYFICSSTYTPPR